MMIHRHRTAILIGVLLALFISSSAVDFLHTEKTIQQVDPQCPACHFQNSSLTATTVCFVILPGLEFIGTVEPARIPSTPESIRVISLSRGPPQA